jgi:Na+/proline symporter
LRKAALIVRNHKTPVDFITDRFQSQLLRLTVLFLQVVPALIYITAQVVALKSTLNSIFGLDEDSAYPVIIIMFITLMFEWLGGINSIALTDCVQGLLMLAAYIALPVIFVVHFGGWKELDPITYPKPEYYQTPPKEQQLDFWQFAMQTFTFFTLPHLMQPT